jgi:hypothetical protein
MPEWKQEIRQRLAGVKVEPAREAAISIPPRYSTSRWVQGAEQAEIDNTRYCGSASFCALSKSVANGSDVCDGCIA